MSHSIYNWRREYFYIALFLIPLLWLLTIQFPASGSADAVFEPLPNTRQSQEMAKETVRLGQVVFNPATLNQRSSAQLELALFDDVVITADQVRTDQFGNGGQVWVGEDPNSPFSEVLLSWNGNTLTGHIQTAGDIYRIGPDPHQKGVHLVELLSRDYRPIGLDAIQPEYAATPVPYSPIVGANATQNDTVVDVLVVYTSAAKDEIGGTDAIQSMINMAVAQTNSSYDASDVSVDLNLVHQQEVSFSEVGNSPNNLISELSNARSSSEINALREEYNADLVAVIRKDAGAYCGIAYVMNPAGIEFADSAYSLITRTCAVANLSFAHETGHNFGAQHDRNNSGGAEGAYSFSYGYQYTGSNSFRTIMGYQSGCPWPCTRIGHWSNNNVFYQGQATGINQHFSNSAANYQTLNYSAPIVATFREEPATPTPTPTNTPTNTHTPTPTNTPTNTPTPTPTFTPTPLPTVVATAPPDQDSIIEWNDFSFEFPSGTFTETVEITILALNPDELPDQPEEGLDTTKYQYQVSAVTVDTRAPIDIVVGQDFTVTIEYEDGGIRRVKEQTLGLFYWDAAETMWVLAPNQDFRENVSIGADGSSLTYFAVLGEETEKAFFPFISRPFP